MPAETSIEWTESTWNPVTGCSKVTPGCAHCYAETFAERWRGVKGNSYEQGFDLKLWPHRLDYPLKWKRPRMIFVNSMSDIFHEDIPFEYVERIFAVMKEAKHHTFQVLTKRHERMSELAPHLPWPENIWMGVTIENKRWILRADHLRAVPARVRFISAEPLLGPLTGLNLTGIHWLIAGGESGPRHRPVEAEWFRELREQCRQEQVAFFFKQWGGVRAKSGGRLLDGREWNEMPKATYSANGNGHRNRNKRKMPRSRDIPDDADEKWEYTEHAAAKHEILHRYLGAWLAILGQGRRGSGWRHKLLVLVDGFAGRGRYLGGESGSPRIMFDRAAAAAEAGTAESVLIRCAEPNPTNFRHLQEVCAELTHERVTIKPTQETFESIANNLADWSEEQHPPPPTFIMVDPYGVRGVSLDTLRRLLKIDRLEVMLTFMVRDPSRFLKEENYEEPMTALFGGEGWRNCADVEDRAECLMLRFREVVLDGVAKHATPFLVYEDERRVPLYYLIHLTNNDLGMREMKDAMVKKSGDMTFWPVTVRPPDQLALEVGEPKPYPMLQARLLEKYPGRTLTFEGLLNDDYPHGAWTEPNYRWAVDGLEKQDPLRVTIAREGFTDSGKARTRGIKYPDKITFL
jgi:three-Cys-motif partner protein